MRHRGKASDVMAETIDLRPTIPLLAGWQIDRLQASAANRSRPETPGDTLQLWALPTADSTSVPTFLSALSAYTLRTVKVKECHIQCSDVKSWSWSCVLRSWSWPWSWTHRHRIDKYLDTLLANQPISDGEATDRCKSLRRKMADCPS